MGADDLVEKHPSLREVARDAVRVEIAERALQLFDQQGFDETTVEEVAAAAGISSRTFFRYFSTKEDAVIGDPIPVGRVIAAEFANRPADEDAWTAMRHALQLLVDLLDDERGLLALRVIMTTPSLRARHLEKHLTWGRLLEPVVVARVGSPEATRRFRAQMVIHGSFACLDVAFGEYVTHEGSVRLGQLLDQAFDALP